MQPWVISMLAAWARFAVRHGIPVVGVENAHTAGYAWRFGLLDFVDGWYFPEPPVIEHEESGRFVPLKRIRTAADITALIADIAPLLHLSSEPQQVLAVQYVMSEMVRNVLEHSQSPEGAFVCAQLYPGQRSERAYVSIGIADCGVGIRRTLARNYTDLKSDSDGLLTAIRLGTSGAAHASADNAGGGLYFTRRLSDATRGYFGLASGDALFRTSLARERPADDRLVKRISRYPGTVVSVEIGLQQPIDFEDFMAETRESFLATAAQTSRQVSELVRFT
jgi:hypothetical protein